MVTANPAEGEEGEAVREPLLQQQASSSAQSQPQSSQPQPAEPQTASQSTPQQHTTHQLHPPAQISTPEPHHPSAHEPAHPHPQPSSQPQPQPSSNAPVWPPVRHHHIEDASMRWLAAAMALPTVASAYATMRPFLACWLISSAVNLMIFFMVDASTTAFLFAEISAIIGVVAGARAVFPSCREGLDLLTLTKQLHVCAALSTMMDMFTLLITDTVLLTLAFNCPEGEQTVCDMAKPAAAFFTFVLGSHGMLSMYVARNAFMLIRMLNPITSGRLALDP